MNDDLLIVGMAFGFIFLYWALSAILTTPEFEQGEDDNATNNWS